MAIIDSSGFHHVRLTVTDIAASKAFYDKVFGFAVALDNSARVDEPGVKQSQDDFYGGVVYQMPSGEILGLRPVAPSGQAFDDEHTGLDHISFSVATRDDLVAIEAALEAEGITHGVVTDIGGFGLSVLSFSDPDGVQLELSAPTG